MPRCRPSRRPKLLRLDRAARRLVVVVLLLASAGCVPLLQGPVPAGPGGAHGAAKHRPLGHAGRWFTDATGRVVMLRGMNFVEKWAPFTPEADGFDDDDAALLARQRLQHDPPRRAARVPDARARSDRPRLSQVDRARRSASSAGTASTCCSTSTRTAGARSPTATACRRGRPSPTGCPTRRRPFPLYYVQNPALQRAFDNFWANRPGPDGVPLQTHYATAMRAVAARFASSPNVIGYEAMNEPWPGTNWSSCMTGCPDLESQLLAPFYARMTAAVRSVDRRRPVFVEPFVLFNFGSADTSLPGRGLERTCCRPTSTRSPRRRTRRRWIAASPRRQRDARGAARHRVGRDDRPGGPGPDRGPVRRPPRAVAVLVLQRPRRRRQQAAARRPRTSTPRCSTR